MTRTLGEKLRARDRRRLSHLRTSGEPHQVNVLAIAWADRQWREVQDSVAAICSLDGPTTFNVPFSSARRCGQPAEEEWEKFFDALQQACLPLTVAAGIALEGNPFRHGWERFLDWALGEELVPSLHMAHGRSVCEAILEVHISPLPSTS